MRSSTSTTSASADPRLRPRPSEADVDLLWSASAPRPDLARVAAAARTADLAAVVEAARHQRVAPLVLRSLTAAGVDVGPEGGAARREAAFRRAQAAVGLPAVARHALVPLHAAGLTPLVHKGGALAGRYAAPGLRPMDDVDLIVPPSRFAESVEVLEAAGWRRAAHNRSHWDSGYDLPFLHPATGGLPVELHYDLARRTERTSRVDGALLWDERVEISICGTVAWGVPPELELLALATHAAKPFHVFNRLIWAVDLAVVAGADVDWDVVGARARALRCRTAVAIGLRFARRLGADVPDELLELPASVRRLHLLDPMLDPAWPFVASERNRRGFALALVDGPRMRGRLLVDELRHPGRRSRARVAGDQLRAAGRAARRTLTAR